MTTTLYQGNCLEVLPQLAANSVQCCVTSPPYWGLRDYKIAPSVWDGVPDCVHEWGEERTRCVGRHDENPTDLARRFAQFGTGRPKAMTQQNPQEASAGTFCQHCGAWRGSVGLEPTPALYVQHLVQIFEQVKRVLRPDGVCFLNIGDSYAGGPSHAHEGLAALGAQYRGGGHKQTSMEKPVRQRPSGFKPKDLCLIPFRLAIALQEAGWWVRSDIIWAKPNPMPESVTDRPTRSHEYVFLLTKRQDYYWDQEAVRESMHGDGRRRGKTLSFRAYNRAARAYQDSEGDGTRNLRTVWTIATAPYSEAHFATFPPALVERCLRAGTRRDGTDVVLDPFAGAGTTLLVAQRLQLDAIGIELNPDYLSLIRQRLEADAPLLASIHEGA